MSVRVVTPPAALVTPEQARAWAPVLADDDDARLTALLAAAQAAIEPPYGWVGRAFGEQTLEWSGRAFGACGRLRLPFPPVRSIESVRFYDTVGADVAMDAADYWLVGDALEPVSGFWPAVRARGDAVRIRYVAGYAADDPALVPVRHAIILAASHLRSLATSDLSVRSETVEGVGAVTYTVSDAAEGLVRRAVEGLLAGYRVFSA